MKLSPIECKYITAGLRRMILEAKSLAEIGLISNIIKRVNGGIRYKPIKILEDKDEVEQTLSRDSGYTAKDSE